MGNTHTACQMSNYSKRNVRVFISDKALEMDSFIHAATPPATPPPDHDSTSVSGHVHPEEKKFSFKEEKGSNIKCIRVLASQTQEVPWEPHDFLSVFVEDEDDDKICAKQILHNMSLSAPVTVLLYDV